ncbi:MAG TPA: ATP-binding protein [Planctomycetota bacterium]|nr:ATP-binding protein [Planctomycetota bacterium]
MSLRSKIVLILAAVTLLYAAADFAIQRATILPSFRALEERAAEKDLERIVEAIDDEKERVDGLCIQWASAPEIAAYVDAPSLAFEKERFAPNALREARVDLLFVCRPDGKVLWSRIADPETGAPVSLRDFPTQSLHPQHYLLKLVEDNHPKRPPYGLVATDDRPLLVSARPIVPPDGSGRRGTLLVGRFLGRGLDRSLSAQTGIDFDFWQLEGKSSSLPPEAEVIRDELTANAAKRAVVKEGQEGFVSAYRVILGLRSRPDFLVRANVPAMTGVTAVRYATISAVIASLLVVLVLLGLLDRTVLAPISALTRHAVRIGKTEDFRAKLAMPRHDEVGILSREFDTMMTKLERARAALVDTARTAGKSEVATGILHNVGNVLNSVNISASLVARSAQDMRVRDLSRLAAAVSERSGDLDAFVKSDRGKHLPAYLKAIAEHFEQQHAGVANEVEALAKGIEHIRELVKAQQGFAIEARLEEPTVLAEQLQRALGITDQSIGVDPNLEIVRRFAQVPEVLVDRHKLLEILVNLVQNARQAMDGAKSRRLTLSIEPSGEEAIRVSVQDTGIGIARENLVRIFHLGFTTKGSGHGVGLHAAANAAAQLGGSISVRSDGPGHGATFVLEIPRRVPAAVGSVA